MEKKSKTKGATGEREVVNFLKAHKIPVKRISMMETNHEDKGDLQVMGVYKGEVKRGDHTPKWLYDSKKEMDFLFCRRDRERWLVVLDLDFFLSKFI